MMKYRIITAFGILASVSIYAQDIERTAPKALLPGQGRILMQPSPPERVGMDDNSVLVRKLVAIVIVADKKEINTDRLTGVEGVVIRGVKVPEPDEFKRAVQSYLEKEVSFASINRLTRDIIAYYRAHDHPVVDVIVPEQDITGGVLQLIVMESKVGVVEAKGNRWFSSQSIKSEIRLRPGDSIINSRVESDLTWLNNNPFREVNLLYSPGKEAGTTDLILETRDHFPLRVYADYENTGNAVTGNSRWMTGFNWGDLFGTAQQLSYQFTTSNDFRSSLAHVATYEIPLPWRHTLSFLGSYSENSVPGIQPLNSSGKSWQASIRYKIPLSPSGMITHDVTAGFDFKRSNNNLEFGGVSVFDTNIDIFQWSVAYDATEKDRGGTTTLNLAVYCSPGDIDSYNSDAAFQQGRAYSSCCYVYTRAGFERSTNLPWNFSLVNRGSFQWAPANLQSSEQFGVGGGSTVRGYEEGAVNGDSGLVFSTEFRSPPCSLLSRFTSFGGETPQKEKRKTAEENGNGKQMDDRMQLLCFWDYGTAFVHQPLPGGRCQFNLSGIGAGVRYTLSTRVSLRFDYGWQLIDPGLNSPCTSRAYLEAIVSY